jgi:hypothetical protein
MAIKHLTQSQLVQIAANGGGLVLSAPMFTVLDLAQIAATAARTGARVLVEDCSGLTSQNLVQIATNGKGAVQFS